MERAFSNRAEAGRFLAEKLENYADRDDIIVLGLPRGGVPVAYEVAQRLRAPLDVFIVRKLGVPGFEELVDEIVCAIVPEFFQAVGQYYEDFSQTSDKEVRDLLKRAAERS